MTITALPEGTIRLLGSAQALTTPTSLVKELVDNALDAKATSVDIFISPNTLDKIEVRDNGHGIPQEDLDALGRRGHTSKLRSFDELKSIGGVSLGFRGEALASAIQLGEVSVTTKTEGEAVATAVKLKAPGGIDKQSRASHPVGTTVCVLNFMSKLPVRQQTALKDSAKTLVKIKELLQAYALARPNVRFSMKITKGGKGSWSFAPRPNDGIKEAVSQVIGRDATIECFEKTLSFPERSDNQNTIKTTSIPKDYESTGNTLGSSSDSFVVELFLPRPDANLSKIGRGQYISIDSRPVSHDKGTMRRIVIMFKSYVKASFTDQPETLKSPFLRLNIKCPVGSYDPNVEPAKDDVLFGDEYLVLESIEQLFKGIYGDCNTVLKVPNHQKSGMISDNFDLLLARDPIISETNETPSPTSPITIGHGHSSTPSENIASAQSEGTTSQKWGFDMSKDYSEVVGNPINSKRPFVKKISLQARDSGDRDNYGKDLNPWLIAKLNAPVRDNISHSTPPSKRSEILSPRSDFLPTPQRSSDPPSIDDGGNVISVAILPRPTLHRDDFTAMATPSLSPNFPRNPRFATSSPLEPRLRRRSLGPEPGEEVLHIADDHVAPRRNDFVSARNLTNMFSAPDEHAAKRPATHTSLQNAAIGHILNITNRRSTNKAKGINKPFVPPARRDENHIAEDNLRQTKLIDSDSSRARSTGMQVRLEKESNLDLDWAMDFEHRKENASRERREELRAAHQEQEAFEYGDVPRSSPHKNRYNAAVATLEMNQPVVGISEVATKAPFRTSLPDGDSRAYLLRRKKSMLAKPVALRKMSLGKLLKLPLEKTPDGDQLYDVVVTASTTMDDLRRAVLELAKVDMYVAGGEQSYGLEIDVSEEKLVADNFQAVVRRWNKAEAGKGYRVNYNFENLFNLH